MINEALDMMRRFLSREIEQFQFSIDMEELLFRHYDEMGHYHYGIGGCQHAEAICFGLEKLHLTGKEKLTGEEWAYVKQLAIDNYPEYEWEEGGYGDFSKIHIHD